jgi:hypothetical protein
MRFNNGITAIVAQLVEQLICNQQVGGSKPSDGFKLYLSKFFYDFHIPRARPIIKISTNKITVFEPR